jgi:dienelactone hydrolase
MISNNGGESVEGAFTVADWRLPIEIDSRKSKIENLWTPACRLLLLLTIVALPILAGGCGTVSYLADPSYLRNYPVDRIEAPNPAFDGPYKYRTYFYGSGADKRRTEYGRTVDFRTEPVDASAFMDVFDSVPRYWGFDLDRLPINGRVWFPEGPGPFPLVLIVHGNHAMKKFSDPGYAYLGTLLASRGFIAVSVDQNFLNQQFSDENDARAFILLEHLRVWDEWNQTQGHPFEGKVDMNRIALIGHSRGGEAVAHAASLNRLSRYPDDAYMPLGYDFAIRSIIAIAPCDGQYMPAGHHTSLENVNYLVIQGGHDADVTTFLGLRQYNRVRFTDDNFWFKCAIYVYRANHSRFNAAWGRVDTTGLDGWFINEKPIMDPDQQRQVAKVLVSAFLEATLKGRDEYAPIFQDARRAGPWLPEDIYVDRYEDSTFRVIADFEEDYDVTTATIYGGELLGENLATWKEADVPYRTNDGATQENCTVVLGWDDEYDDDGDPNTIDIGSYTITLSRDATEELDVSKDAKLVFSVGAEDPDETEPLDLTIELRDRDGNRARLPLSSVGPVHPALPVRLCKWKWLEKKEFDEFSERLLQTYEIPIQQFVESIPSFEPSELARIRFVFDRSSWGTIMLDDVGISNGAPQ